MKAQVHRFGVQTRRVYVDGYGKEQEVANMSDSHIVNTIGYIQGKLLKLDAAQQQLKACHIHSTAIVARLTEMRESIIALGQELTAREAEEQK